MSAQEIIAELEKLDTADRQLVQQKLVELESPSPQEPPTGWGKALLKYVGVAGDLPADLSVNHDHYLYGAPKRE
jgi:hypothetical protein